ncbi:MAG: FAD-dependent oxidoreductase, partial [Neisseria elongata]
MQTAVWNDIPPLRELLAAAAHNRRLAVCLPEKRIPRFEPSEQPDGAERRFLQHWPQQSACLQFAAANILRGLLPQGAELWLMPPAAADCLSDYFSDGLE